MHGRKGKAYQEIRGSYKAYEVCNLPPGKDQQKNGKCVDRAGGTPGLHLLPQAEIEWAKSRSMVDSPLETELGKRVSRRRERDSIQVVSRAQKKNAKKGTKKQQAPPLKRFVGKSTKKEALVS